MDNNQQIERELVELFVQKQKEITRINKEIDELEKKLEPLLTQRRQNARNRLNISQINDEISKLEIQLSELYNQLRQDISRIDDNINELEKQMGVNLDPPVRKNLHSLCDKINNYMQNPELEYPYYYDTTDLMQIILALSVNPRRTNTTSAMVQKNIHAIAEFMRRRIMLNGDANNTIISCKAADDGVFDIHLSLKSHTKDLRIYSVKKPFCLSNVDMVYTIGIDLTDVSE
jgi:methyl-accepting chemotaxis protein